MTNREWINQMSDEKFVRWFYDLCDLVPDDYCRKDTTCEECKLNWLKEEHKENEDE